MSKPTSDPVRDETKNQPGEPGGQPPGVVGPPQKPGEVGGPKGPEPTRYGDWEVDGRCTDF